MSKRHARIRDYRPLVDGCGKIWTFASVEDAERALESTRVRGREECRYYRCKRGYYHLTSQPILEFA